jgi:hypothetical protein
MRFGRPLHAGSSMGMSLFIVPAMNTRTVCLCHPTSSKNSATLAEIMDKMFPDAGKALEIVAFDERDQCTDREQIFEDLITHRKNLVRKNPALTNLALRFVSGACELRQS